MPPTLPLEVIERIIDDVATDYHDTHLRNIKVCALSSIKACALVCHSLLPVCRKHIFASVTLNKYDYHTSNDLNHLLSNSPHLAVYIRKLDYHVGRKELVAKRSTWSLPMFKNLTKLQELSIDYTLYGTGRLDWVSSPERKVLLPLFHVPALTRIHLADIRNFPLADLAGCVNLKELKIGFLEWSNDVGNFLEALPPTPAILEQLEISQGSIKPVLQLCHARRPDGKPIIDFFSLRIITATVARLDSLTELIGICRNLRKIDLTIRNPGHSESASSLNGLFTLLKPSLPTLERIDIVYDIHKDESYDGPLAGLCHELEKMAGQNVVETIALIIWVWVGHDCTRWGELDDVLMGSPEGWPALRRVFLSFAVFGESHLYCVDIREELRELPMTKLRESKRVQFDFRVG